MRRKSATVIAACAVLLAGAPAGVAAPPTGSATLVVTGTGPSTGTFTLEAETSFFAHDASITIGVGGRYGGVLFRSERTGVEAGGVYRVTALETYGRPDASPILPLTGYTMGSPAVRMPPGTYRAYLLGDGPVEVRLPLDRGRSLTVRPTAPSTQRLHVGEHRVPVDADPDIDHFVTRHAFQRPALAWSALVGMVGGPGLSTNVRLRACFSGTPTCLRGGGSVGPMPTVYGVGGLAVGLGMGRDSKRSRVGTWHGIVEVTTERAAGATVWLSYLQVDY